jgi:hypothetical protein
MSGTFFWNVTPLILVDKYVRVPAFWKIINFSEMLVLVRLIIKFFLLFAQMFRGQR